jgi:ferredoxin-NADP reductase/nitrite reductase/ring-hydroxylating ferredoxin subunit
MSSLEMNGASGPLGWHVVASSADLVMRHVFHARVGTYNLALWRSDDGAVNAWENRCPHRSVPLTMGMNLGHELRCQYHGWRFATGSGECTTVPAESGGRGNRAACVNAFDCVEQDGWVWVALGQPTALALPALPASDLRVPLRALVVHAGADTVWAALSQDLEQQPQWRGSQATGAVATYALEGGDLRVHLQYQSAESCILHSQWLPRESAGAVPLDLQRSFNSRFERLRSRVETEAAAPLSLELLDPVAIPLGQGERSKQQTLRVLEKIPMTDDTVAFHLAPIDGLPLAAIAPGSHLELTTPSGLVRHYSLVNGPADRAHYLIGVKREPASRGGSASLWADLQVGQTVVAGRPVNHFALQDAAHSVLVAGGIGITPILSMAQHLKAAGRSYELHYFVRSGQHLAFAERLFALGDALTPHVGLDVPGTGAALRGILAREAGASHLYVCGPRPLMELAMQIARSAHWPQNQVHSEYFGNDQSLVRPDDKPFSVVLHRSGTTLQVPVGQTIAQVVREAGIHINTVCEQGVCGSCETAVLEGEPDHRDIYGSPAEHASRRCTMVCVSRSQTPTLVLDL